MRIEYDVKLGFKDVMFRPKRSTLKSRSQVSLERSFKFMHTGIEWTGVPVMAANMDTVGTFEMAGVLAGHDESGGEVIEKDGKKFKQFYGMSSSTAMNKHVGGVANYRASEGKTVEVPYRGDVESTLNDVLGGVRSTCTYVGASALKELTKRTTFIRVAEQENRIYTK